MENRLVIEGIVGRRPDTRVTPAGVPISRFPLRHLSRRLEAGVERQVTLQIGVMAVGAGMQAQVSSLTEGERVRATGFLCRANNRQGEFRLVLHAEQIEAVPAETS